MEAAVSHHESSQPQRLVSGRLEFSLKFFFEEKGYLCVGRTRHEADLTRGRKRLRELIFVCLSLAERWSFAATLTLTQHNARNHVERSPRQTLQQKGVRVPTKPRN